jgi:hypothetical protein
LSTKTKLVPLATIAAQINEAHANAVEAAQDAITRAFEVGRLLTEAKAIVRHGEWGDWIEKSCNCGVRQAQKYMRAYENRAQIEAQMRTPGTHLASLNEALAIMARPAATKQELTLHPYAGIFPAMTAEEFSGLKESIQAVGQIVPITVYQGQVIDGKERLRACRELGIDPIVREWDGPGDGESLLNFVWSSNMVRTHHTRDQIATVMVKAEELQRATEELAPHEATIEAGLPKILEFARTIQSLRDEIGEEKFAAYLATRGDASRTMIEAVLEIDTDPPPDRT